MFEQYLKERSTETKVTGYIKIEDFFRKHFNSRKPSFVVHGLGATKEGVRNYIRIVGIIEDLGKMGVISEVDEAVKAIDTLYHEHY